MPTRATGSSKSKSTATGKKATVKKVTAASGRKPASKAPSKPATKAASKPASKPTRATAKPVPEATATQPPTVLSDTPAVATGKELKKNELIAMVVERSGLRKKFAKPAVEAMIDILGDAIAEGRPLNLQPLGKVTRQRTKDTVNARITVAKIRQSKRAGPALSAEDRVDGDNPQDVVADAAE